MPQSTLVGLGSEIVECLQRQAEGVSDFEWSPKDNVLAYWAPEQANAPARVSVVEIPSRKELRQKNLVMVSECRLHWQASTGLIVNTSLSPPKACTPFCPRTPVGLLFFVLISYSSYVLIVRFPFVVLSYLMYVLASHVVYCAVCRTTGTTCALKCCAIPSPRRPW